jgi:hypothetical protein
MTKLVYSSERAGCGATIQLDSGDICIVSVAQAGVRVRTYRPGRFLGSFFGPILYDEKNVYANAQTAQALSEQFPEQQPNLMFENPVLCVFANAIWHCSTPAEVAKVLNEAPRRPFGSELCARPAALRAQTAKPSAGSGIPPPPSMEQIIRDYGAFMEQHPSLPTRIEDATLLPHRKELILDALFSAMGQPQPKEIQEFLRVAAMSLVQFQYNVGSEPLEQLGMDVAKFPHTDDFKTLKEQAKRLVEVQRQTADRFNEFSKLVEIDLQFVMKKIAAADALRRC